jgi:hypothetical protein
MGQHKLSAVREQVNALRNAAVIPYHDLLDGGLVEAALEEEKLQFRVRIYTPLITLWTFLTQVLDADQSCRQAVLKLIAFLVSNGQPAVSPDTGNYTRARKRLPLSFIARLVRTIGEARHEKTLTTWLWKGRSVMLVDGSTVSMPDTEANQRAYPQPSTQKPGLGFPLARIVGVICLATGVVMDLAMGPYIGKRTGEISLLRALLKRLKKGTILLGDRYFSSYFGIAELVQHSIDGVFRMHQSRKTDFRRGRRLAVTDHLVRWKKPQRPKWMDKDAYAQFYDEMWVRELRFQVDVPGYRVREIVLATTLLDPIGYTKEELADLFLKRWNIELDLRSIKVVMKMDVLRCLSPEMVEKEVWMHMLAYNVIRGFMATAGAKVGAEPRQLSFKGTLQAIAAFREALRGADPHQRAQLSEALIDVIGYDRVGDRPGRVEPRCRKRRPKPYPLLVIPREEARKRLLHAA